MDKNNSRRTYKTKKVIKQRQTKKLHITIILGFLAISTSLIVFNTMLLNDLPPYAQIEHNKRYAYNERVPVEVVKAEIVKQANEYGVDADLMLSIAFCESGYNNIAKNPDSTALGSFQYLIRTWQETDSFKLEKKARTDYKANILEATKDVANGEIWRWNASKHCWN